MPVDNVGVCLWTLWEYVCGQWGSMPVDTVGVCMWTLGEYVCGHWEYVCGQWGSMSVDNRGLCMGTMWECGHCGVCVWAQWGEECMGTVRCIHGHGADYECALWEGWGGAGVRAQCAVREETAARVRTLLNP